MHSSSSRRMRYELLDVFEHFDDLSFLNRWEIVKELGQWTAVLEIIDQCPKTGTASQ